MLLIIDNFDSFTYNLYQLASMASRAVSPGLNVAVYRCDEIDVNGIVRLNPSHILLSPGPGRPKDARLSCDIIRRFMTEKPIFGVCLGMQCMAEVLGARVIESEVPVHGKVDVVNHDGRGIFTGIPSPIRSVRYHSLIVCEIPVTSNLRVTATNREGLIMGLRCESTGIEGVQFHPEAILTDHGLAMMENFLQDQN